MAGTAAADDLDAVPDINIWFGRYLTDEVVGHAVGQGLGTYQDRDLLGPLGQVHRGLPGRVAAAGDEDLLPAHCRCLADPGTVENPAAPQVLQPRYTEPPVGSAGSDDHGPRGERAAVGQSEQVVAILAR